MSALQVLHRLRTLDVRLWAEGDRLRYDGPDGALTPELREEVKRCRDELLVILRVATAERQDVPVPGAPRPGRFPVSMAQRRLWIIEQLESPGAAYHVLGAVRLRGTLDVPALRASLVGVVRRHETLRTSFEEVGGEPVQVVASAVETPLEILEADRGVDWLERGRAILTDRLERPFELTSAPLMRAVLMRHTPQDHLLGVAMHHLVSDGQSVTILVEELTAGYAQAPPVPPRLQYGDHALAARGRLAGPALEAELDHWRRRLAGAPQQLDLPADRSRPPLQSFDGATVTHRLPPRLSAELRALSARENTTLFTALLAGFTALIHRYTDQTDLVVGAPFGGRSDADTERLIGCFVNTLPLRCDLSGDPSFRALIGRTRATVFDALAHDEVPFEMLVDALHPPRDPSRPPIVQVLFGLQPAPVAPVELAGLTIEPIELDHGSAKFDLSVSLEEAADGSLSVALEYATDLFDAARIERLAGHYERLLGAGVANADARISELELLSRDERRRLLIDCGTPAVADPGAGSLSELFERQAARSPDATALQCGTEVLSYRELDERANRLAHRLRDLGVGPETLVALCLGRSSDLIVAMLGILKAGGAYVPLDPAYPAERMAFIMDDTRAPVLVTESRLLADLPSNTADTLCVDVDVDVLTQPPEVRSSRARLGPENLAYVIYTSGSTGRPKGVAISHRSALAMLAWARTEFSADDLRAVLASTSICFDLSVFEILLPLSAGTTVVLAASPLDLLERHDLDVTLVNTVPSAARQLVKAGALPRGTRVVCLAGEPLPESLAMSLYELPHVERVYNLYGPSEDTTYSTVALVARTPGAPPIGRAIAGTRAYVLDRLGHPVPAGVFGELYLGGQGLARGYHERPATTAERFVPDPFGEPGARLYRTGDRVRRRSDGQLEFLGRVDDQVKIRGYRIEPGEVEATLVRHPSVREAVVVPRAGDEAGDPRLVAYVATDAAVEVLDLRRYLGERLPSYLVPSAFVLMDTLPLTPTGKVDRLALPDPRGRAAASNGATAGLVRDSPAPRDEHEATLAAVWAAVLDVSRVGVHDNFFDLGGDSILALQAVARASRMGLAFTARDLLTHQTVAELARVAAPPGEGEEPQQPAEAQAGRLPLTPVQRWFFDLDQPHPDHWNQAVMVTVDRSVDSATVVASVHALVQRHPALRTRFVHADGDWQAEIDAVGAPAVVEHDLSATDGWAAELDRRGDALQSSLDLAAGRVFAAALFDLGPCRPQRLLLVGHHLVVDGVTWRILLEELELLCAGRGDARLSSPGVTPRAWALGLESLAHAAETRAEVEYWVAAAADVPELPRDRPLGRNRERSSRRVSVQLSPESTRALLTDANRAYRTRADDLLMAALADVLARWTGSAKVRVDVEHHGRDTLPGADASRTAGWFTTIVPTALRPSPSADPGARVLAVKEQLRAVPGTGAGFGLLRHLARDPELVALPAAEVSFNYLGRLDRSVDAMPLLRLASGGGAMLSPEARRPHLLEVVGRVEDGCLRVDWRHGDCHDPATVEALATAFRDELQVLIAHCKRADVGGVSPSDFPGSGLDGAGLAELLTVLDVDGSAGGATARAIEDVLPLSLQQQGMLLEALAGRDAQLHLEQVMLAVSGSLDPELLRAAWQRVVDRHPALRSALTLRPSALQVQFAGVPLPIEIRGAAGGADRLEEWLEADRTRGFETLRPPLMRVTVLKLAADRSLVVWTFHHAVIDGWSVAVVLRELLALYAGLSRGGEPALPDPMSRRAYHRWLVGRDLGAAERFWRTELAGVELPTRLGRLDESNPASDAGFGQVDRALGVEGSARVEAIARARHLTLTTVVHGAWAVLLARLGDTDDVVFGTTVSGRPPELPGVEDAVGLFINTLPFRAVVPPSGSFWDWLDDLQLRHVAIREHDHAAGLIHGWTGFPGGRPLYESVVVVENYPAALDAPDVELGAEVTALSSRGARTRHLVALLVSPGERIGLQLVYDGRRIDVDAAERMMDALGMLFGEAAAGEKVDLSALLEAMADDARPVVRPGEWERAAAPVVAVPPRSRLELELAEIWEELLGVQRIGVRQSFFDLGGHSLLAVHLLDRIRERYGFDADLAALVAAPTIDALARTLQGHGPSPGATVRLSYGSGTPLFLVPGASGNPMAYLSLARSLGEGRPCHGLVAPGLVGRGITFSSIEELAALHVDAVRTVQSTGRYILAGHSFGGAVAWEMARQLVASGESVGLVAILDLQRPCRAQATTERDEASWVAAIAEAVAAFHGRPLPVDSGELRRLTADRRHQFLLDHLIRASIVPPDADISLVPRVVELYRASERALAAYDATPLDVPVALVRASDEATRTGPDDTDEPTLGWQAVTSHEVQVHHVPGGHITMIIEPHVTELGRLLGAVVAAAEAVDGRPPGRG